MENLNEEFEAIALPHIDAIYRAALYMSRDRTEAEDLVQATFLRAYKSFEKLQPGTSIKVWLFKILQNIFSKSANADKDMSFDQGELKPKRYGATLHRLTDNELRCAIDDLPEELGQVINLSDLEGFSYGETAMIIGCTIGTVMSRLRKGREMLHNNLQKYAIDANYISEAK